MLEKLRLKDKAAIITGGGAGIGAASARLFCMEGASVFLVDSNDEALQRTKNEIRVKQPDAQIETFVANVADASSAKDAVAAALRAFGRLDVLVNNASMRNFTALSEVTLDEWNAVLGVNLIGTSNFCQAALPALRKSGRGSIVNVSSCYAVTGRKGMGLYDTTKAGLMAMTRTFACEEAAFGVRANVVCPGSTLTDFHVNRVQASGGDLEEFKTQRKDTSLIGRWASPEEIAWPILWMASDESSFMTATSLMVDGGLSSI